MSDGFRNLADTYLQKAKLDRIESDKSKLQKDRRSTSVHSIDEREELLYEDPALKSIDTTFQNADVILPA